MKRKYVLIGLTGLVVIAIASPAIGGPSLKKLVKKEVARQISKATGPAGAPGALGPQGAPGPANLLVRSASADDGNDVTLATIGGFRFFLDCAGGTEIDVENISGGADSVFEANGNQTNSVQPDFDEAEIFDLVSVGGNLGDIEDVAFGLVGSNGTVLHGQATVVDGPVAGFGGADCVGSMTVAQ